MRLPRPLRTVTDRISLCPGLPQPSAGGSTFDWVIAETYEHAYLPMVDALERHPGIRVGLHYTGPLLDWIRTERPEFLDRLARPRRARPRSSFSAAPISSRPGSHSRNGTGSTSSAGWRSRSSGSAGAAGWRLAGRAGLGAGPADVDGRCRLPLDDRHWQPLPGGGLDDEERCGAVHHRGPGPPRPCSGRTGGFATGSRSGLVEDVVERLETNATAAD